MIGDRDKFDSCEFGRSAFLHGPPTPFVPPEFEAHEEERRKPSRFWENRYEFVRVIGACWGVVGIISLIVAVVSVILAFRENDASLFFFAFILVVGGLVCMTLGKDVTSYIIRQVRDDDLDGGPETQLPSDGELE